MKRISTLFLVPLLTLAFSNTTWATTGQGGQNGGEGSFAGNGADPGLAAKPQAWFLGPKPIEWCLAYDSLEHLYRVSAADTVALIQDSFATWRRYFEVKKLRTAWPAGVPFPEFNDHYNPQCAANTELVIYVGSENDAIKRARARYVNARGLAELTHYDAQTGRGRGFVWLEKYTRRAVALAPPQLFQALLVHELGHVLGNSHVGGTLMRQDLAEILDGVIRLPLTQLERMRFHELIDQTRELFFARDAGTRAFAPITPDPNPTQQRLFQMAHGRKPTSPINLAFQQGEGADRFRAKLYLGDYTGAPLSQPHVFTPIEVEGEKLVVVTQGLSGGDFPIRFFEGSLLEFNPNDNFIFRSVYRGKDQALGVMGYLMEGEILMGSQRVPIVYYRNRGDGEFIRLTARVAGGDPVVFFRALLTAQPVR